jgi:hypothetical protein
MPDVRQTAGTRSGHVGGRLENIRDVLDRWNKRLNQGLYLHVDSFQDQSFDDLVAVLVAAAYIEAMLWMALHSGKPNPKVKSEPLSRLIKDLVEADVLDDHTAETLRIFSDLRNEMAHNIEARLTFDVVREMHDRLPAEAQARIVTNCSNIHPEVSEDMMARFVLGEIAEIAYVYMYETIQRIAAGSDPQ